MNRYGAQNTGYSYGAPVSAPDGFTPLPRNNGDVRFNITDDIQTPQRPAGNTEQTRYGTREQRQNSSDNDSDHGSNNSSASQLERTEARRAFRHVLNVLNAERFAGDKKSYITWKIALLSEVDHIQEYITPDMWLRLLIARTQGYANSIVQNNKAAQEIIGTQATVEQIWNAFEKRYAADRYPGCEFLKTFCQTQQFRLQTREASGALLTSAR